MIQATTENPQITEGQLEDMKHALGLGRGKKPYRNYFYTERNSPAWNDLVAKELATLHPGWEADLAYFKLTYAGAKLAYGKRLSEQRFKEL